MFTTIYLTLFCIALVLLMINFMSKENAFNYDDFDEEEKKEMRDCLDWLRGPVILSLALATLVILTAVDVVMVITSKLSA